MNDSYHACYPEANRQRVSKENVVGYFTITSEHWAGNKPGIKIAFRVLQWQQALNNHSTLPYLRHNMGNVAKL
jgi:hypothetical protein